MIFSRISVAMFLGAAILLIGGGAMACVCAEQDGTQAEMEKWVRMLDLVVEAKVVGFKSDAVCKKESGGDFPCVNLEAAVLSVSTSYKGTSGESVEVALSSGCHPSFASGSTYFVVAQQTIPDVGSPYYLTNSCLLDIADNEPYRRRFERYREDWSQLNAKAEQSPQDPEAWQDLALYLEHWEDYPSALSAYRKLAELQPVSGSASVGRMLFYQHDAAAKPALERAAELNPKDAKVRGLLALTYARDKIPESDRMPTPGPFDFRNINFWQFEFTNLDLRGADFRGANLRLSHFKGTNLSGANFRDLILDSAAFFEDVDLTDADLQDTLLYSVEYAKGAKLVGARIPIWVLNFGRPPLADLDLAGAHILCGEAPDPAGRDYFYGDWKGYMEEIALAREVKRAQPAAELGPACLKAIANYLEPTQETAKCARWIDSEKRPPECEIRWDE